MSDNTRTYKAIRDALKHLYPREPQGNIARRLNVLTALIKGRALPIVWIVVRGKKGHLKEKIHLQLIEQLHQIIPSEVQVVFLGDGEFDGIKLLDTVQGYGWQYVCRTGKSSVLF